MHRSPTYALALSGLLLVTSGCGGSSDDSTPSNASSDATTSASPSSSPSPSSVAHQVAVTVQGQDVTPVAKTIEMKAGETIELDVTADRAGELHVHSSPEQELEFEPGKTTLEITIDKPGQVDVEEHVSDSLILRLVVR